MRETTVKFYEGEFAPLSNFSAHQVRYKGVLYFTAEHAYQCQKFNDKKTQEKIRKAPSAFLARELGQITRGRKENFDKVVVMKEIMRSKLLAHTEIQSLLKKTGKKEIIKNHPLDSFWGTGKHGKGDNMMGKIWMELREEFFKALK